MSTLGDSSGSESGEPEDRPGPEDDVSSDRVSTVVSTGSDDGRADALERDLVFDVLKNRRRRYALHYLRRQDDTVQLSELAEQVAAWENDSTINAISAAERKRVYTALYQSHLPKLDDAGIVDYDQNRGNVELSETAEQLDVYLDLDARPDTPWYGWYLALAGGGLVVLAGGGLGVPPFSFVPGVLLATAIVTLFTVVALVHTYFSRFASAATGELPPELDDS